jgi:hypothetical protein
VNTFNRFVLIFLCLVLVVAAVAIISLTWTIPNRSINWLSDAVQWMDDNDGDMEKALLTSISAFIGLVAVIVLLIELIPRRGPAVQVTDTASGSATLPAAAIAQRIEEAVVQVPHVSEVRANVKSKRKGVIVGLDLQVDPEANLATVTDEACQTASEVLTQRVHVTLLKPPTAKLHYRELRLHRGNGAAPRRVERPALPQRDDTELQADVAESSSSLAVAEPPAPAETPDDVWRGSDAEAKPLTADEEKPVDEEKPA